MCVQPAPKLRPPLTRKKVRNSCAYEPQLSPCFLRFWNLVLSPMAASAQQVPGPHPAYLHALSDLRLARAYLDQIAWPPVQRDEEHAIREIDAAINEIKQASIDDGKDLADHPRVDVNMRPDGRFRKALELLDRAHNDTAQAEDVPRPEACGSSCTSHRPSPRHGGRRYPKDPLGRVGTVCKEPEDRRARE